jgi:hypothetical protein
MNAVDQIAATVEDEQPLAGVGQGAPVGDADRFLPRELSGYHEAWLTVRHGLPHLELAPIDEPRDQPSKYHRNVPPYPSLTGGRLHFG